jgi:hypothetical protein
MPKRKLPPDVFESYTPPAPKRAIVVSISVMAFCEAVYQLGLEPSDAWRATSPENAREMQAAWREQGIDSYIVPLPEMLREDAFEDDDVTDGRHQTRSQAAA